MARWTAVVNVTSYDLVGSWTYARIITGGYGVVDTSYAAPRQGLLAGALLEVTQLNDDPAAQAALILAGDLNAGTIPTPPPAEPGVLDRLGLVESRALDAQTQAGAALERLGIVEADVDTVQAQATATDGRLTVVEESVDTLDTDATLLLGRIIDLENAPPPDGGDGTGGYWLTITTTFDVNGEPVLDIGPPEVPAAWGINADGEPYYDPAGAVAGEEAFLFSTTQGLVWVPATEVL